MLGAERLELTQDQVELLRVALVVEQRVLEEREGGTVGGRELAEEKVPSGEEVLEDVERGGQLTAERGDALLVRSLLAPLCVDLVRRSLPDAVEPVEEDVDRGARASARSERAAGPASAQERGLHDTGRRRALGTPLQGRSVELIDDEPPVDLVHAETIWDNRGGRRRSASRPDVRRSLRSIAVSRRPSGSAEPSGP